MQKIVPRVDTWLVYEQAAKAEGRREPYSLDSLLREELPEGKTICNKEDVKHWHQFMLAHDPGSEAYAVYNLTMCEFEEIKCLR